MLHYLSNGPLGIPCEGAVGPNMVLSPEDRSVIYGFLVEQAFADSDDRILSDENLDRHKLGFELPAGVRLLNERTIRQMSKQATVRYVGVSELEVHGTCVEAGYYTSCYHEGEPCGLCCESRTYIFRKVAGRWEHEFFSGAVM